MKLGNFCFDVTIPRWRTDRIEIHDAPGMCAYYRGIRVANLQKPAG